MELMAEFEDNHFDLAIVDPPYGIGMDGGCIGYNGDNHHTKKDWDKEVPKQEYFEELMRVSKNQIIWGGNYFNLPPSRGFVVWDKGNGFKNRTFAECELAWLSFDCNAKIFSRDPLAKRDYIGKIHPTQKPVHLYTWLLSNYAKDGDKILDTMVGSASSLIACHQLGFDVVGCELDEEYYQLAQQRIKEETAQLSLF